MTNDKDARAQIRYIEGEAERFAEMIEPLVGWDGRMAFFRFAQNVTDHFHGEADRIESLERKVADLTANLDAHAWSDDA